MPSMGGPLYVMHCSPPLCSGSECLLRAHACCVPMRAELAAPTAKLKDDAATDALFACAWMACNLVCGVQLYALCF